MDPYRELDVPRTASKDDVKRAYKRKAHETHPDRAGGDKETFQRVNAAYKLLSDDTRRARYDQTGQAGEVPDERAAAITMLGGLILHVIDQVQDLSHFDVVSNCRAQLNQQLQRLGQERAQHESVIQRRAAALKRLKRRGDGENLLARVIEVETKKLRATIARGEAEREALKRVIAILDEYQWQVDPQQSQSAFHAFYMLGGQGGAGQ